MQARDAREGTRISFELEGETLVGVVGRIQYSRRAWYVPVTLDKPHPVWSTGPALPECAEVRPES